MLHTMKDQNDESNSPLPAEVRKAYLAEMAELTGEQYTVECRLQWINNRLNELRAQLTGARKHGNSRG